MNKVTLLVMIIFIIIGSCTKEKKSPIEGCWKIVYWKSMRGDSVLWAFPDDIGGSEISIFSKSHFIWAGRYRKDTTWIPNYGSGTYKLNGNQLEETILYSVIPTMISATIKSTWEQKNDTAIRTCFMDENWQRKKEYTIQKWIRLE